MGTGPIKNSNIFGEFDIQSIAHRTLHVSDRFSVHHRQSSTLYTATGKCHTGYADCLLQLNLYDIHLLLCDDVQKICPKHVESYPKNKFEKLLHYFCFFLARIFRGFRIGHICLRHQCVLHREIASIFLHCCSPCSFSQILVEFKTYKKQRRACHIHGWCRVTFASDRFSIPTVPNHCLLCYEYLCIA